MRRESGSSQEYQGGWRQRSIEMSYYYEGKPRGLDAYETALGFRREDLRNKEILDLGAGKEVRLSKEVSDAGLGATVIEMSPDFLHPDIREKAQAASPDVIAVAGLGQNLPFKNESFDDVLVLHVLEHLENEETFFKVLEESARVLRPGGRVYLGPVFSYMRGLMHQQQKKVEKIKALGVTITEEEVPEKYGLEPLRDSSGMKYGYAPYTRLILEKSLPSKSTGAGGLEHINQGLIT